MSDETQDFLARACLTYGKADGPDRVQSARDLLEQHPELASANVWCAACVGDVDALRVMLDADPSLATTPGGPQDWEPLLYASYSRLNLPGRSTLDAARLLLAHGADPDAHWMWGDQYRFTAITGAFGEGEGGPKNQPPHEECEALARLLLDAGADPNDAQALYNTMFTPCDGCLELLLEYGLGPDAMCNWLIGPPTDLRPHPQSTMHYQLMWAIRRFHTHRARLLIEHGADVTTADDRETPWKAAVLAGHTEIIDDLLSHGAAAEALSAEESFAAACMAGDRARVAQLQEDDAEVTERTRDAMPGLLVDAAATDRRVAARCLVDVGWDVNALPHGATALHQAAWNGHVDMARLLIELGADPRLRDRAHDATPAEWATHNGQTEVASALTP